ncbi:AMIN domain-containing protein [Candidatus Gracilibacteria bacterium]|nr:AMIN domain-containing protein [Candidatus Gracilibacteria bacterium]NJM88136.1 AMIN domain-containing protein [Hydrococcus sp. RU_2_2]NJP18947.1 AMIN domain-containing protein [Hydrococcus sp. CRU_1_1]
MKVYWLLLSTISLLLFASPAEAGKLLFWRFETNQSKLLFSTDERVQPRAQLIFNPSRVAIDLPGITLGRPSVRQSYGGHVRSVRVGQFDAGTTRIVIELAPGYTVDPQQVRVRGLSPTQWTVELPEPERVTYTTPSQPTRPEFPQESELPQSIDTPPPDTSQTAYRPISSSAAPKQLESNDFQVTRNGLFVRLDSDGDNNKIKIERSRDRQKIEVALNDATLPDSLISQQFPVNSYGIKNIEFAQISSSDAQITLNVGKDSPDWQALYSRFGGLILLPKGGMSSVDRAQSPIAIDTDDEDAESELATIESADLDSNNQLIVRSDRDIKGNGNWNRLEGTYEIRIPNAQLSESFVGPQLDRLSPIYQLRLRQEEDNTVVIIVKPALGVKFGELEQSSDRTLALSLSALRSSSASLPPRNSPLPSSNPNYPNSNSVTIPVPPPPQASFPSPDPYPAPYPSTPPSSVAPRSNTLVVIDPGHGGKDPGAIGIGGLREKDVVLSISQSVTQSLQQQGVRVMMTRNSDYFVSLQGRAAMANRARATVFVSIHANAVGGGRSHVNGLEVYYYGNRSLADAIHRSILQTVNVRDRGVRRARFYVLRKTSMPAALVETGYVTGVEDNPKLRDAGYQRQMAEAIARGIVNYLQRR